MSKGLAGRSHVLSTLQSILEGGAVLVVAWACPADNDAMSMVQAVMICLWFIGFLKVCMVGCKALEVVPLLLSTNYIVERTVLLIRRFCRGRQRLSVKLVRRFSFLSALRIRLGGTDRLSMAVRSEETFFL